MFPTLQAAAATSEGWPDAYGGVMLQGFYWDSYKASAWTKLEKQAENFKGYFDLIWVPQSAYTGGSQSMGYDILYYFNQKSSFGTEDELLSMISTFKENGIGTIADVVVNHRKNVSTWFDFPAETYNGVTYQMKSTDIVADDDGGATATEAASEGVTLSSNNDEGEGWSGMRDLDHQSENVQNCVTAYVKFLKDDMGYTGFRYDMVKGFAGSHVAEYNDAAGVEYSVGEYWDGNASTVKTWINNASMKSAAFDFPFRYTVRDAINNSDWTKLANSSVMSDASYRRYAVTFVENHDTEYRSASESQDPIYSDTLAANAFLLAMPGTPCVFYKHYLAYPEEIKAMIDVRKAAGITNTSTYVNFAKNANYYVVRVSGNQYLMVVVGSDVDTYTPSTSTYTEVLSGYHYKYYLAKAAEVAFADKPSGQYTESFQTTLTAVSATSGAQLVYTTDGTTPTASNGTKVASGTAIDITASCTLKVGLLVSGSVTSTIERTYTFVDPEEEEEVTFETPEAGYTFTAYFIAPTTWDSDDDCYAWVWNGSTNYTGGEWPGDNEHVYRIGQTEDGAYIWQWCYYGSVTTTPAYIIFNNASSGTGNQTANMTFTNGGWYNISTTASDPTLGISTVATDNAATSNAWYTLQGVQIDEPTQRGIYIHGGKKVVVK